MGRYVVLERIGAGNMGIVYRAYDPELDRRVALKLVVVRGSFKRRAAEVRARLLREAQALARVGHPNVIQVHDVGTVDEDVVAALTGATIPPLGEMRAPARAVFLAMEYVEGSTLRKWTSERERLWREVVGVFRQAARGLWAAHQADVIHRDFKPDNVMIGSDGRVRVLDFGLARAAGGSDSAPAELDADEIAARRIPSFDEELTQHGTIIGTPAYMAPEQHVGGGASAASDQFAFCVALWEALYGSRPFAGETHAAIAFAIVHGRLRTPPPERRAPRWLHRLLVRGLQIAPEQRFPTMLDIVDELERDRNTARRVGIGALGLAAGVAGVLAIPSGAPSEPAPCTGADRRIAEAWNEPRREAIASAFAASDFPFARETWTSAERIVDDWTRRWSDARTEACRATRVYGEQSETLMDLRIACLDRSFGELEALLELYASADRRVVIGAVDAARSLGDLEACSDTRTLGARTPLPTDPGLRTRIAAAESELARLHARAIAGALEDVGEELRAVGEEVLAIDHPPLTQELMAVRALVQFDTGATKDARASWEQGFRWALVAGDHRTAVFFAGKLAFAIGARLADEATGRFWADTARALLRTLEDPGRLEMAILSAEASIASTKGDYEGALAQHARVRAYWEEHDPSSPELAVALGNIGTLERQRGNAMLAETLHRQEMEIYREAYGAEHPLVAAAMRHVATALATQGKVDDALAMSERALAIHRAAQGDRNVEVATALDEIGQLLRSQGRLDEAVERHREALEIWRHELGPDNPDVAISQMQIGYTLAAQGRSAEALDVFDRARVVIEAAQGDTHPHLIYIDNAAAKALLALERPREAKARAEAALASKAVDQVDPTLVAESKFLLARAMAALGEPTPRAVELAREAQTAYQSDAKRWAEDLANIATFLASHDR
ncbi:MAG TPA: serine/threonine-protein kinase [Nannocystaceae bacterium]|nr:serine/threonine-protein kinase [Nannocystaceae bacterium]